jgi:multicomponent Na+:H+ antiporter subunit G
MIWLIDIFIGLALLGGVFFIAVGSVGMLRMPDFYTRMHAAGIIDTLGAGLILLGLMLQAGWTLITVKLLLILAFLWFTSPTACHALIRAALADPGNPRPLLHPNQRPSVPSSSDGEGNLS